MPTMTKPPKSIFDLIDMEEFRKRTAMYIGDKDILVLKSFIDGYF
jgi:DNA gyrase/topoisomerase IV subunit B